MRINDLQWHRVAITQHDSNLTLSIDQTHHFHQSIQGDAFELNIKYGLFLGSQDVNFKSLYLGQMPALRGCLDEVHYNGRDVMQLASTPTSNGIVHELGSGCDDQFSGLSVGNSSMSFTSHQSFVVLPSLASYQHASSNQSGSNQPRMSIEFDIKTMSENAVLLFNPSDNPYRKQFTVIELIGGYIKLTINDGSSQHITVDSDVQVNTGHWQKVMVHTDFGETSQISVNGRVTVASNDGKLGVAFKRMDPLRYSASSMSLGGISTSQQSMAINYRLQSVLNQQNVSLQGCLRNLFINSQPVSILDAIATNHITTGQCKWNFLCTQTGPKTNQNPCRSNSRCVQRDVLNVECHCSRKDGCVRPGWVHNTILVHSVPSMTSTDGEKTPSNCHYTLATLNVLEGSRATVHAELFKQTTFNQSENVNMKLVSGPQHGVLEHMAEGTLHRGAIYQWHDLRHNQLSYRHDGSEHGEDSVTLLLLANGAHDSAPCSQQTLFHLPIRIHYSASDDPQHRASRITIQMIANSKKVIEHEWFEGKQTNNGPRENKIYKVHKVINGGASYFTKTTKPNSTIKEFTDIDLHARKIKFVHVPGSDGNESSSPVEITLQSQVMNVREREYQLMVHAYPLTSSPQVNTGIVMMHHTHALVYPANLSYMNLNSSEPLDNRQLIKYEIITSPNYGQIQKLRSSPNHWSNVSHFTQRQIDRNKIRYLHQNGKPKNDSLRLQVTFNKQIVSKFYFNIEFVDELKLISIGQNSFNLNDMDKELTVRQEHLNFITEPFQVDPSLLTITLMSVPSSGNLYVIQNNGRQTQLNISSQLTLQDVFDNKLLYVKSTPTQQFNVEQDSFVYKVSANGSNASQISTF